MKRLRHFLLPAIAAHAILIAYAIVALAPMLVVILNSFKNRRGIFGAPLALPDAQTFSLGGYDTVLLRGNFELYFANSAIVTISSLALIVLFGVMAAFALSEYRTKINSLLGLYFVIGIMIPIRLGTVAILSTMVSLGIAGTLVSLILVYVAQGLPLAVYVLSEFMKQVSDELKDAGRIDGLSEPDILFRLVVPVVRPAIASIAVFSLAPIWNDLWFPMVLAPAEATKTVTLGAQNFMGQFATNWSAVLAALTLSAVPILVFYLIFSRQIVRGITAGAVK